jgi:hypothetical protein
MRECDNSKIHISSNFLFSICLNSRKSPASSAEPSLMTHVSSVKQDQFVSANRSAVCASIRLFPENLQSCDWGSGIVSFVRLALNAVKRNDGDFVDVILLCCFLTVTPLLYLTPVNMRCSAHY